MHLLSLIILGLFLLAVPLPAEPVTDLDTLSQPGRHRITLRVDDHDRLFVFFTPKGFQPDKPLPLVFFFHGAGGNAEQAARTYGWTEKAEAETFFAVFPQGLPVRPDSPSSFALNPNIWRDERSTLSLSAINDVRFFEVLLAQLQAHLPVDPKRVYVTGFSNGGGMTFTLGSHFSSRIAAIAPVSSQSFVQVESLARPLPVYYLTGTADPLIPFHGGPVRLPWGKTRTMPPVQDSVDLWARLDGCPPEPQVISDEKGIRVVHYCPGKDNAQVIFTTIEGNGHHWPGTVEPLSRKISGPSLDPFPATDRIWEFFKANPLP